MSNYYGDLFENWEIGVAKNLINEFLEKSGYLVKEEYDDLLQECLSHWHFSKGKYDCKRKASPQTFMGKVVRHKLTDMVRERTSEKRRAGYEAASLDVPIGNDNDAPSLLETLDSENDGSVLPNPLYEAGLQRGLSKALCCLTNEQRRLCRLLGEKDLTVKEISECLKIPRSTIYDEIKRIRAIFEKWGLKVYLDY